MKKWIAMLLMALLVMTTTAMAEEYAASIVLSEDGIQVSGIGVTVEKKKINIISGGVYEISGEREKVRVIVDAGGEEVVLYLRNAVMSCSDKEVIETKKGQSLRIVLPEGTASVLTADGEGDNAKGAVRVRGDLWIEGAGTLTTECEFANAIHATGSVSVDGSVLIMNAQGDGLQAKQSVNLKDATLVAHVTDEGIQCGDDGENIPGDLAAVNSSITVYAEGDALKAGLGSAKLEGCRVYVLGAKNAVEVTGTVDMSDTLLLAVTGKSAIKSADADKNGEHKLVGALEPGTALELSENGTPVLQSDSLAWEVDRVTAIGTDLGNVTLTVNGAEVPLK